MVPGMDFLFAAAGARLPEIAWGRNGRRRRH
jgi:hypothetical protein